MDKYRKLNDYDATTINPEEGTLALACCDCGLVHHIKLEIAPNGKVVMALKSDKRATAQLRRYGYGDLQQGKNKLYKLVKTQSNK